MGSGLVALEWESRLLEEDFPSFRNELALGEADPPATARSSSRTQPSKDSYYMKRKTLAWWERRGGGDRMSMGKAILTERAVSLPSSPHLY